jgi:hypothetical protein
MAHYGNLRECVGQVTRRMKISNTSTEVSRSKHFLLSHNDAHNYKITGILKQLKFRRSLQHVSVHAGTIIREPFLGLAKTTVMVLYPRRTPHTRTTGWYAAMTLTTS